MRYEGRIFRPPSEARSYILQATIGCKHNTCAFCDMYFEKDFRERQENEIIEDIQMAKASGYRPDRVLLQMEMHSPWMKKSLRGFLMRLERPSRTAGVWEFMQRQVMLMKRT